ncbi:MAG: 16S rRNA (cytidine(1402)-2'-O)-methyltransferase [Patescibacteria group bacterium]|nr:16S rRNA (cytidine(1402)-2'-O)-methyltransferase [Patescibacteria group bacterium]
MLYIVATPIGNLKDITLRAIETLKACEFVMAENPHYSKRLLEHIGAWPKEMVQFAEHNEQQTVKDLARRLAKTDGCLITDAGTPGISDPGFRLVRECVKENVSVVPLPGANAATAALSASGLPTDRFLFLGFPQKTAVKTVSALQAAADAEATAIFYESPERIIKTLNYVANAFPSSQVVIARELTKIHEEFLRGSPYEVLNQLKDRPSIKGELTVLVSFKS